MKTQVTEKGSRTGGRDRSFHLLINYLNGQNCHCWAGLRTGARRFIWVSRMGAGAQVLGLSSISFPGTLAESWTKWSRLDLNWHPYGIWCHRWHLNLQYHSVVGTHSLPSPKLLECLWTDSYTAPLSRMYYSIVLYCIEYLSFIIIIQLSEKAKLYTTFLTKFLQHFHSLFSKPTPLFWLCFLSYFRWPKLPLLFRIPDNIYSEQKALSLGF